MKKYILVLLTLFLIPFKVLAAGGFGVSPTSISMYPGESKTITITSDNAVGKLNISSSNGNVLSINTSSIFIQNPGSSGSITITAKEVGSSIVSVVASNDFATMDEEILAGQTKSISVNVIAKPSPSPSPSPSSEPTPTPSQKPSNNNNNNNSSNNNTNSSNNNNSNSNSTTNNDNKLSKNNNIKELTVEGYELTKVDDDNYTLTVPSNVSSINVNALLEDDKAKISGTGKHELNIGENTIEIVVTSESGSKRSINIKVNRKDSYYIDDLDLILNDSSINDVDITIGNDTVINKDDIKKIKDSNKTIRLNYYDENKKLIYSWILDSSKLNDSVDFNTSIMSSFDNKNKIYELSNYADGLYYSINNDSNLKGIKLKVYVGDKYENNSSVNIYSYDGINSLEVVEKIVNVVDGYVEFEIDDNSSYFITMSNIKVQEEKKKEKVNIFMIISIIEMFAIIGMLAYYFMKIKEKKK